MLLPLIGEVINKLKDVRYFSKIFEPKVMYFGLCNLLETFQRMMNSIFQELLHKGIFANYMNDFVIPAKTKKELSKRTV